MTSSAAPVLTAPGIGSGLDIKSLVQGLMQVESAPLTSLQQKDQTITSNISDYGRLKSAVSSFHDVVDNLALASSFQVYKATSANTALFTATADSSASAASVNVDVIRLAQNHKMAATPFAKGHVFSSSDTGWTDGKLDLSVGGHSMEVDMNGKNLSQIRDAINTSTSNPGVVASVITDSVNNTQTLTFTAKSSGEANRMTVTDGSGVADAVLGLHDITAGNLDAEVNLDGVTVNSSSNTIKNAIQGVTLTLLSNKDSAGNHAANLAVDQDRDTIKANIQSMVNGFNSLRATMNDLEKNGLAHESTVSNAEQSLMSVINSNGVPGNAFTNLSQIGVSMDKSGKMNLDTTLLDKALDADFNGVSKLFTDDTKGFAVRFMNYADQMTSVTGAISTRTNTLKSQQKSNQDQEAALQRRLDTTEQMYLKQFNAMDSLVGSLNQTKAFLTKQFA